MTDELALHDSALPLPYEPVDASGTTRSPWGETPRQLSGLPGGMGLNIAYEAVDRHAPPPQGAKVAIRWLGRQGEVRNIDYAELRTLSDRFALALRSLGVPPGERRASWRAVPGPGCLREVAPEADLAGLRPGAPLRDQLDIDSMDFLNFVIGLDRSLRVAVPESEYHHLATLDGCVGYVGYVAGKLGS